MNEILNKALDKPFATALLIGTITSGIANIVRAAKKIAK